MILIDTGGTKKYQESPGNSGRGAINLFSRDHRNSADVGRKGNTHREKERKAERQREAERNRKQMGDD